MTLAEIEASLPWGFQDAFLEGIDIDWVRARLVLTFRLMMGAHQDEEQRCRVVVEGLAYCAIDPPAFDRAGNYAAQTGGLWIGSGSGPATEEALLRLPSALPGHFVHWFFVQGWNSFIHVSGREATLSWLDPTPTRSREGVRSLFPGEVTSG